MSIQIINLRDEAEKLRGRHWQSRDVAYVNGHALKMTSAKGEYAWHKHDDSDEMFLVHKGKLTIKIKDHPDVVLNSGEAAVVPKGVWHCPKSDSESIILLFEPVHLKMTTK